MSEIDDPAGALAACLDDPEWRMANLYQIITKSGRVETFRPNRAQRRFLANLRYRNLILKARQLGMTTLVCLLWLDTALFSREPIRCGVIAQDRDAAEAFFRDKVRFAYDNLPPELRDRFPLASANKSELVFGHNGASIRVATSMRSGTIHRLHISEYGKICARYQEKAQEVKTGSIPAVPQSGIVVIESTAEGQQGDFYERVQTAMRQIEAGSVLSDRDYRLHFYAWFDEPDYVSDLAGMRFAEVDLRYFAQIEAVAQVQLSDAQRAWYVRTRDADFSGDAPTMWQEYPSTADEAFKISTEGCWYAAQLTSARLHGRVVRAIALEPGVPVNTFWDLGRSDMTAAWFHQRVAMQDRFLRYYEASGEELIHYAQYLQSTGYVFGTHYLPHEADHKRMGESPDTNRSLREIFQGLLPGQRFEVVPRVTNLQAGITATRAAFATSWFDEVGCKQGLLRLSNYRKAWDRTRGCWSQRDVSDDNAHGADAYRQFGQERDAGNLFTQSVNVSAACKIRRKNRSAMAS